MAYSDYLDSLQYSWLNLARGNGKTYFQKMFEDKIQGKTLDWKIFDECDFAQEYKCEFLSNNNKQEEQKSMLQCEFALGDVWVGKNKIDDENDGELVLICPGYNSDNFDVTKTNKGVRIEVYKMPCENCGETETEVYFFEFSDLYEVVDVKHNVRDGILVVQTIYDLGEDVEIDDNL